MIRKPLNQRFLPTFNEGVLYIAEISTQETSFGAVTNAARMSDMRRIQKLDYKEMSKRERDYEFAQAHDHTLDLKVKTPYHPSATTDKQVLIGRTLYDIYQVDGSAFAMEMYLYLEKVRDLEE